MYTRGVSDWRHRLARIGWVLGLVVVLWISGRFVLAATSRPVAFVSDVSGTVDIVRRDATEPTVAGVGMLLFMGDQIRTGQAAWVEIEYYDDVAMRIEENTHITINEPPGEGMSNGAKPSVTLSFGEVWVHVTRRLARFIHFSVETPAAVAGVRGTIFQVQVAEGGETDVRVLHGEVEVMANSDTVRVAATESVRVTPLGTFGFMLAAEGSSPPRAAAHLAAQTLPADVLIAPVTAAYVEAQHSGLAAVKPPADAPPTGADAAPEQLLSGPGANTPPGLADKTLDHQSSQGQTRRTAVHERNAERWLMQRMALDEVAKEEPVDE